MVRPKLAAKRREAGLCPGCGGARDSFTTYCLACKAQAAVTGLKRKAAGLCSGCGGNRDSRAVLCTACRKGQAARYAAKIAARTASGDCTQCGAAKADPGKRMCAQCRLLGLTADAQAREQHPGRFRQRKLEARRDAGGQCHRCEEVVIPGLKLCTTHWFRATAANNLGDGSASAGRYLEELLGLQGGLCPYTGQVLVPGVNAEIDHIFPISRYPELATDPDNVMWVSYDANQAKGAMTNNEFVQLCRTVVAAYVGTELDRSPLPPFQRASQIHPRAVRRERLK